MPGEGPCSCFCLPPRSGMWIENSRPISGAWQARGHARTASVGRALPRLACRAYRARRSVFELATLLRADGDHRAFGSEAFEVLASRSRGKALGAQDGTEQPGVAFQLALKIVGDPHRIGDDFRGATESVAAYADVDVRVGPDVTQPVGAGAAGRSDEVGARELMVREGG